MQKKIIIFLSSFCFMLVTIAQSQFKDRFFYNARLEPENGVMTGAGQSNDAFMAYWDLMEDDAKPLFFMSYQGLKDCNDAYWIDPVKSELTKYDRYVIPQIGLSMTVDGQPEEHYEGYVASGDYDQEIENFCLGLKRLGRPAFVRIGYEFNGFWNGYEIDSYINAFIRVTNAIRAHDLEVATVWCYAVDAQENTYISYYPGSEYVDWIAMDIFRDTSLISSDTYQFLDFAKSKNKPVMIGETTPKNFDHSVDAMSWPNWFEPFFELIHDRPGIKAFCYINWDWSNYDQWSGWGDARLGINDLIAQLYKGEMDSAQYFHSTTEGAYRKSVYPGDTIPPTTPGNIVFQPDYPPVLSWSSSSDQGLGLAGYEVELWEQNLSTRDTFYVFNNLNSGDSCKLRVRAKDRAYQLSPWSDTTIHYRLPMEIDKLFNGEFDYGQQGWSLFTSGGASASWNVDTTGLTGTHKHRAKVTISQDGDKDWNIQLKQVMDLRPDRNYHLSFMARADTVTSFIAALQEDGGDHNTFLFESIQLDTSWQHFSISDIGVDPDLEVKLSFMLGQSKASNIWIDSVVLIEEADSQSAFLNPVLPVKSSEQRGNIHVYPNPANDHFVIESPLLEKRDFGLNVIRQDGSIVLTRLLSGKPAIRISTRGWAKGLYFLSLQDHFSGAQFVQWLIVR